MSNPYHRWFVS